MFVNLKSLTEEVAVWCDLWCISYCSHDYVVVFPLPSVYPGNCLLHAPSEHARSFLWSSNSLELSSRFHHTGDHLLEDSQTPQEDESTSE